MCTGRIWSSPRSVALFLARITTFLALSVNRSNIADVPLVSARAGAAGGMAVVGAARVLLMHCLPGDAEDLGDLLPGPSLLPGVVHLQCLQLLQQPAKRGHGPEPGPRVRAVSSGRQGGCVFHDVNLG